MERSTQIASIARSLSWRDILLRGRTVGIVGESNLDHGGGKRSLGPTLKLSQERRWRDLLRPQEA